MQSCILRLYFSPPKHNLGTLFRGYISWYTLSIACQQTAYCAVCSVDYFSLTKSSAVSPLACYMPLCKSASSDRTRGRSVGLPGTGRLDCSARRLLAKPEFTKLVIELDVYSSHLILLPVPVGGELAIVIVHQLVSLLLWFGNHNGRFLVDTSIQFRVLAPAGRGDHFEHFRAECIQSSLWIVGFGADGGGGDD